MNIFFNFIIIALLIFTSCNLKENSPIEKKILEFKTGFEVSYRYSGIFIESKSNIEYIYFADPMTTKCLKIFDIDGNYIDSIPLAKAMNFIGEINGLSVKSRDTVIINSAYTNLIAIINHNGDFIKKIEIDSLKSNTNGSHFEMYSSFLAEKLYNNSIIYHSEWRYNINEPELKDPFENFINFNKKNFTSPYFFKITDYLAENPTVQFGMDSLPSYFSKINENFIDVPRYTIANKKLFFHTIYSNKLYIINPISLRLEKTIEINSKYTKIGTSSPKIEKENINDIQDIHDSIMATTGQFYDISYNKKDSRYYLIVYHAVPSSLENSIGYKKLPYSILSMDSTFSNTIEFKMDAIKYFGGFNIMTSKGLLINTPNEKNNEINTFTLFEFKN